MNLFKILFCALGFFLLTQNNSAAQNKNSSKEIYSVVEKMPKYQGGDSELLKYLKNNIQYPIKAQKEKIEGIVFVTFVINKKGKIENPKVVGSVHPLLDEEALRLIIKMPKWIPGSQKGENVSVQYNLPIRFKLNAKK